MNKNKPSFSDCFEKSKKPKFGFYVSFMLVDKKTTIRL